MHLKSIKEKFNLFKLFVFQDLFQHLFRIFSGSFQHLFRVFSGSSGMLNAPSEKWFLSIFIKNGNEKSCSKIFFGSIGIKNFEKSEKKIFRNFFVEKIFFPIFKIFDAN